MTVTAQADDVATANPLIAAASTTVAFTKEKLSPELAPPPELVELEKHVEAAKAGEEVDVMTTGKLIYAVMCEQVIMYDQVSGE